LVYQVFKSLPLKIDGRAKALLTLIVLSPAFAELLTTSTTPWDFFNPINFLILIGLYGSGAVLVREFRIRYNLGYGSLILLGMAYGILEEGLAVESFFNPEWKDLGIFGSFGRWLGVNWVWAAYLTLFHSVWSITVPIVITEALFRNHSKEPWIERRSLLLFLSSIVFITLLFNIIVIPYNAGAYAYMLCLLVIIILIEFSKLFKPSQSASIMRLRKYFALWFLWAWCFLIAFYVTPLIVPSPLLSIFLSIILAIAALKLTLVLDSDESTNLHAWAFAAGPILVLSIIDILASLQPGSEYKLFVGALFITIILIIYRQLKRKTA